MTSAIRPHGRGGRRGPNLKTPGRTPEVLESLPIRCFNTGTKVSERFPEDESVICRYPKTNQPTADRLPGRFVPMLISAISLAAAAAVLADGTAVADEIGTPAERAQRPLMHFRVLWMHDPATEAVVSWSTLDPGSDHRVYFDTESHDGKPDAYAHTARSIRSGRYTMLNSDAGTPPAHYHHVHLRDLPPDTTIYFTIASDDLVSREFHFVTAPDEDRPLKVLFGGDSRRPPDLPEVHAKRREVNRLIASLAEEHPDILAFCHGGDYCSRAQWRFMTDWLSDHELTITGDGRILPIIPARGNHDREIVFEEMFYWPERSHDYYYSTHLSPSSVVVTLNTEISMGGDQRKWLAAELERLRAEPGKTILVQYHVPAYGSVKSFAQGAPQRQYWVPLFEKFQVDLVAESDHHSLKRTLPIYQGSHDPERGIVYIGDGGLGVPQRVTDPTRWYLQPPGMATSAFHVHIITFSGGAITAEAIGLGREVLDEVTIESKQLAATGR